MRAPLLKVCVSFTIVLVSRLRSYRGGALDKEVCWVNVKAVPRAAINTCSKVVTAIASNEKIIVHV